MNGEVVTPRGGELLTTALPATPPQSPQSHPPPGDNYIGIFKVII